MAHTQVHPHPLNRFIDMAVDVHFGDQVLPGTLTRVVPTKAAGRILKVVFDDPMTYGGMGAGWFRPSQVSLPGMADGLREKLGV
jgi:hypothetical protein